MEPYVYEEARQRMIRLSRNLGIAALVISFMFSPLFFLVIGLTALSVLFALLSRGKRAHIDKTARTGVIAGAVATVITLGMLGQNVYRLYNDADYRNRLIETSEAMYGDAYRELYGIEISDLFNDFFGGGSNGQ